MRLPISTAVVGALLLTTACNAETTPTTSPTTTPTTSTTSTTSNTSTSTSPTTIASTTSTSTTTTTLAASLPKNAQDYATAAFDAWVAGDTALLDRLVVDEALETLDLADPSADWQFQRCEGAAGSVYCTWESEEAMLTFRVGSEAVAGGEEDAILEVLTQ